MIQVVTENEQGEKIACDFDTNAVEVIDGALVIYTHGAKSILAGFAPGHWSTFQFLNG